MIDAERKSSRNFLIIFIAIVLIIFGGGSLAFYAATISLSANPSLSTLTICDCSLPETSCILPAQPMGASLRILSDNFSEPIDGANVTATHNFYNSGCGLTTATFEQTTQRFETNQTEWYSLDTINGGNSSILVEYLGHSYDFTVPLGYSAYTCATLYLPSGETNTTTSASTCERS